MQRLAIALAYAALAASVACGKGDSTAANASEQPRQVTYEGCLQKGAGMFGTDYLLTMLNEPSDAVGTSGSVTSTGSSVEREQMRMAAQMYRVESKGDVKLGDMVGKQVRVSGVLAEQPRVPTGAGKIGSALDSQLPNRDRAEQETSGAQMNTSDLGKLDVSSATVIAESCGARGYETSGRTNPDMAGTQTGPRVLR